MSKSYSELVKQRTAQFLRLSTCGRGIVSLTLLALLISVPVAFGQSPLDQPSEKKITVGSEIERGRREMDTASNASRTLSITRAALDLDRVFDRNRSQNTDSDGFLLGASLGKWMHLDILLGIGPNPEYNNAAAVRLARQDAVETFAKMRQLQKKLAVDDDALLLTAGFKHTEKMKEMMDRYEAGGGAAAEVPPPTAESSTSVQSKSETPTLTLTQSISIQLPDGSVVLQAGTKMQIMARNGGNVQVRYMDAEYEIPISATDLK